MTLDSPIPEGNAQQIKSTKLSHPCLNWKKDFFLSLLVSDPFPEPKSNLPVSISGKRYGVPLK